MSETERAKSSSCIADFPVIAHVMQAIPGRIIGLSESFVKEGAGLTHTVELRLAPITQGDAA